MRVPGHVVDGRGQPFPQGNFLGRIKEVKDNWSEDGKTCDYLLTLGDNTPIDEKSPNVGARPFITRLTVVFQNQSIVELVEFTEKTPFALQRTAGMVSQLAVALGYAARATDGSVDFNTEEFLENLLSGAYKDRQIGYEVRHRGWKSKEKNADGTPLKSGTNAEPVRFFGTDGAAEAPVAAAPETLREVRARA